MQDLTAKLRNVAMYVQGCRITTLKRLHYAYNGATHGQLYSMSGVLLDVTLLLCEY